MRLVSVVVVLLALCGDAHADREKAARYFAAGQQAFEKKDYLTAIRVFELSSETKPHPSTTFALAQAYRFQFHVDHDVAKLRKAIDLYRHFAKKAPKSTWRPMAEQELLQLVAILARQSDKEVEHIKSPSPTQVMIVADAAGARVTIDGEPAGGEIAPAIRTVTPGKHAVRVAAPGYREQSMDVVAVESRLVLREVSLSPLPGGVRVTADAGNATVYVDGKPVGKAPVEKTSITPGRRAIAVTARGHALWSTQLDIRSGETASALAHLSLSGQRKVAYATGVGAGALALAGLVTGILATSADSTLDSMPRDTNAERGAWDSKLGSRDRLATATTVLLSSAAVALATAVALWWIDFPETPTVPSGAVGDDGHR